MLEAPSFVFVITNKEGNSVEDSCKLLCIFSHCVVSMLKLLKVVLQFHLNALGKVCYIEYSPKLLLSC